MYALPEHPFQVYALPKFDFRCMHFRNHFFSCMHLLVGFIQMYALPEFLAESPLIVSFPLLHFHMYALHTEFSAGVCTS